LKLRKDIKITKIPALTIGTDLAYIPTIYFNEKNPKYNTFISKFGKPKKIL